MITVIVFWMVIKLEVHCPICCSFGTVGEDDDCFSSNILIDGKICLKGIGCSTNYDIHYIFSIHKFWGLEEFLCIMYNLPVGAFMELCVLPQIIIYFIQYGSVNLFFRDFN